VTRETGSQGAQRRLGAIVIGGTHGSLAVARSLGRRGIPVWVIETDRSVAGLSRHVEKRLRWKGPEAPGALDWLMELADRHDLTGWVLFPCADPEICFLAENYESLARRFRLSTMPWSILGQMQDKRLLCGQARKLGMACPTHYVPDDATGAPEPDGYPVVIKPALHRRSSRLPYAYARAWRADNRESLLRLLARATRYLPAADLVVQEFIPGGRMTQFSYAGVWNSGRPVASMVTRRLRQHPIEFGTGTLIETVDEPSIEKEAERILGSVGYHGLVEVEFKFDSRTNSHKIIDVNTGAWSWIGLGEAAGVDFPWLAWQAEMGSATEMRRPQSGTRWRYLPRDLLAAMGEIVTSRITLRDLMDSLLHTRAAASFALDDPLPGLLDLPLVAARVLRRLLGWS
jgi:D-aspartate ligase